MDEEREITDCPEEHISRMTVAQYRYMILTKNLIQIIIKLFAINFFIIRFKINCINCTDGIKNPGNPYSPGSYFLFPPDGGRGFRAGTADGGKSGRYI